MENDIKADERKLNYIISKKLVGAYSKFENPTYENLLASLTKNVFGMFTSFSHNLKKERVTIQAAEQETYETAYTPKAEDFVERNYPRFERELLVTFISAIPSLNLIYSAADKDILNGLISDTLNSIGVQLPENQKNYLTDGLREAFKIYVGLTKTNDRKAEEIFENRVQSIITGLKSQLKSSNTNQLIEGLKTNIKNVIEDSDIDVQSLQIRSMEDQFLWLFADYTSAPEDEREEIYERAEQRIIISVLDQDSHAKSSAA